MRNILKDRKGSALMVAALTLPVLIGASGLATDTVQWTMWKRQLQRQADSAAMAGAFAKTQAKDVTSSASADITRNMTVSFSATPLIQNAPVAGPYAGNPKAVRVLLQTQQTLPFSSLFIGTAPVISAEATAAAVSQGNYCVIALETNATAGITMQGNATVNMGCGMASNSKGANSVVAGGSSMITATPVASVGGLQASSNYATQTVLQPYSVPQDDPFAQLPIPSLPNQAGIVKVGPHVLATLSPGSYAGMNIQGTVKFNPGIYYIDGGSLSFGSLANVSGTDVTFILTSSTAAKNPGSIATVDMNGSATVNLSASTTGTYAGILIYQDPRALDSGTNQVNGNSASSYQGAIYMPRQELQFSGNSSMKTDCLQLVARRVVFTGNSNIVNNCPAGSGAGSFTGTRVRLVG